MRIYAAACIGCPVCKVITMRMYICCYSVGVSDCGGDQQRRVRVLSVGTVYGRVSSWQPRAAHRVGLLWTLHTRRSLHRLQLRTHGLRPRRHRRRRAQLLRQAALHVPGDVTARRQQQQRRRRRRVPAGPYSAPARQVYLPERWGNWISRLLIRCRRQIAFGRVGRRLLIPFSSALNGFLTASHFATHSQCPLSASNATHRSKLASPNRCLSQAKFFTRKRTQISARWVSWQ